MDANWLSELKDIHTPPPLSEWTLAPGWWLVLGALGGFLAYRLWSWLRHYRANHVKKQALRCLKALERNRAASSDIFLASEIDALLKRTALFFFPRETLASLSGKDWLEFLDKHDKKKRMSHYGFELTELPYHNSVPNQKSANISGLLRAAKAWVKQRSKPCSH